MKSGNAKEDNFIGIVNLKQLVSAFTIVKFAGVVARAIIYRAIIYRSTVRVLRQKQTLQDTLTVWSS